jgi:hypothetical protein
VSTTRHRSAPDPSGIVVSSVLDPFEEKTVHVIGLCVAIAERSSMVERTKPTPTRPKQPESKTAVSRISLRSTRVVETRGSRAAVEEVWLPVK